VRSRLAAASFTQDVIAEVESAVPGSFGGETRPIIHHLLRRRADAAGALGRLFVFGDAVEEDAIRGVLSDFATDALLEVGILARDMADPTRVRSPFLLRPFEDLWLLADDLANGGADAVMPPAGTTAQLARVMPRSISDDVLDIGCGPGSLALVAAARGSPRVVGTDLNPRATEIARFNACLNGIGHAEFLLGDLTEPVRGRQFGLVVAQPPFVVQPPEMSTVMFLHGGPSGEEVAVRLIGSVPEVLAPDGRAIVLMEAAAHPDEPLHARLRPALGNADVDLLVLAAPGPPPSMQVIAYASLEAGDDRQAYATVARRYLEHFERLGASMLHHGLVVLRDRSAARHGRIDATLPVSSISRGDSGALERVLANVDLAALADAALKQRSVRATAHAVWVEERQAPHAEVEPTRSVRFNVGSFGSDFTIDHQRYHLFGTLDGAPSVEAAITTFAVDVGATPEEVESTVLGFVREGLMRGVLEPG
jgi:SAM-dependent methyltransferase